MEECLSPPLGVLNRFPDVLLRELDYGHAPEREGAPAGYTATAIFEVPAEGRGQPPAVHPDVVRYAVLRRHRDNATYRTIATELEELAQASPKFKPARITHWRDTAVKSLIRSKHGEQTRLKLLEAGELSTEAETE
jgi:hypothetical protein